MKNTHDINRRIKIIKQTRQITKAMHLIATAKMKRAMSRYTNNVPYFHRVRSTLKDILNHSENLRHPFFLPRTSKRTAYLIIGADKGLAGGYNYNLNKFAHDQMEDKNIVHVMTIGYLVYKFLSRNKIHVNRYFLHMSQDPSLDNARFVAYYLIDLYKKDNVDEIWIIYTEFISAAQQKPKATKLLPVNISALQDAEKVVAYPDKLEFYPSRYSVFDTMVPEYLIGIVYGALVHAYASEQSARMNAMEAATRNANDLIDSLTREYNKARQWGITQEIIEISAGAKALDKGGSGDGIGW